MIVPKPDLRQIVNGKVGEATVRDDPPPLGAMFWLRESPRSVPACRGKVVDVWPLTKGGFAVLLERTSDEGADASPIAARVVETCYAVLGGRP